MIKSRRLEPIVQLAVSKEKNAIQALGDSYKKKRAEQSKLDQLIAFRDQYARQLNTGSSEAVGVNTLLSYRSFVAKLDKAISEQRVVVSSMDAQLGSRQSVWNAARSHKLGMQNLLDSTRAKELVVQIKREQAESDDRRYPSTAFGNGTESA